jgi:hypothetical protein
MWNLDPYFSSISLLGEIYGDKSEHNNVGKNCFVTIGAEKAALPQGRTLRPMIMRMVRTP